MKFFKKLKLNKFIVFYIPYLEFKQNSQRDLIDMFKDDGMTNIEEDNTINHYFIVIKKSSKVKPFYVLMDFDSSIAHYNAPFFP